MSTGTVIILGIIFAYMVALLVISYISTKKMKAQDTENFLLAGKNLNAPLVSVVIAGLAIGGVSTVGVAENSVAQGLSAGWYNLCWAIGAILFALILAKKTNIGKATTVIEAIEIAHGPIAGFLTMIAELFVGFAIFSMQMVAGGAILASLLPQVFTLNMGMLASAVIFGLVAIIGGLWSAALSNIVNVIVIYIGMFIGLFAIMSYYGGWETIQASLPADPKWFSFYLGKGWISIGSQTASMIVLAAVIQTCIQTSSAAKNQKASRNGFVLGSFIMAPTGFIAAFFGITAVAMIPGIAENPKLALPSVIGQLNPWIAGLTLAGLWAADVSTAVGLAVGQSTMFTKDVWVKYINKNASEKSQVFISRVTMAVVIILGYFIAINMRGIIDTLMKLTTVWAPICVLMYLTFALPKLTRKLTGPLVMIGGTIYGFIAIIPALFPESGFPDINAWVLGQAVWGCLIVSIALWLISLAIDKRPSNWRELYDEPDKIIEKSAG